MPDEMDLEIKEACRMQVDQMHLDAMKKFAEDFGIDMRAEMKEETSPSELADSFPEEGGDDD